MESNKLKVNAIIEFFNVHTKEVWAREKVHNMVVNTGLNALIDDGLTNFSYIAIGTSNTAVGMSQTDLFNEVARSTSVTPTNEGVGIREYDFTFTFGTGESYNIKEAGIFDSPTISGGNMFNRFTFTGHDVDVDNGIRVIITITLANA